MAFIYAMERSCRFAKLLEEPRGPLRSGNGALASARKVQAPLRVLGTVGPRSVSRPRSVLGQTPISENGLKWAVLARVSQQSHGPSSVTVRETPRRHREKGVGGLPTKRSSSGWRPAGPEIGAIAPRAHRGEAAAKAPWRSLRLRGPHGVHLCDGAKLPLRQALRGASRPTALRERCFGLRTQVQAPLRALDTVGPRSSSQECRHVSLGGTSSSRTSTP